MIEFLKEKVLKTDKNKVYDEETLKQLHIIGNKIIDKPIIFVGTGTCGLGAGAGDTAKAVETYIKEYNIDAKIIKTGCIGLCSSEPVMDVQLPGMNRISFEQVTEDKVENILSNIFNLQLPDEKILGQFMFEKTKSWEDVNNIFEHPFFKPQKRIVLKNCG
ncbi:MAG: (2Fe-2S) ferredoxin domain-containing protein, partial [Calditrichales bacterium]|nr:(2Fe-2S) ferredoxin domain-containing protein [Calditrichales bacterium]